MVFGLYLLFLRFCSDDRFEIVVIDDFSEKIFLFIFYNFWFGGSLSGEC